MPWKLVMLALLAAVVVPTPLLADEDWDDPTPLLMQLHFVGSLTSGHTDFIRMMPPGLPAHMDSDEMFPLFGAEGEEAILPYGTIDELIELVKNAVRPVYWERREGADIRSSGEQTLVVRAGPEVQGAVHQFLLGLERRMSAMIAVDVHTVRLSRPEVLELRAAGFSDGAVSGLLHSPRAGPSQSLTAFAGMRAAAFGGRQRAWLADQETQVAKGAQIPNPWVRVANLGLGFSVVSLPVPGFKRVLVGLDAWLSELAASRTVGTGQSGSLEAPSHAVLSVRSAVVVESGAWTLVDGTGSEGGDADWYVLLRATVRPAPEPAARAAAGPLDGPRLPPFEGARPTLSAMPLEYHPVRALSVPVENIPGEGTCLRPSRYTPPEPPELPEPMPIMPPEALVDLIREAGPEAAWEDPSYIEVRNGILMVRNTPAVHRAIGGWLDTLRSRTLRTLVVTAELLELDAGLADALGWRPFLAVGMDEVVQHTEAGDVRLVDVARVTSLAGSRNTTTAGRLVSYVYDYEAEVAEDAAILNPSNATFLDGVEVDVHPYVSVDGSMVHLTLRFLRSRTAGPIRTAAVHGGATLELPELEMQRVRTAFAQHIGRPTVVAAWGHDGRRRVLVLTANWE